MPASRKFGRMRWLFPVAPLVFASALVLFPPVDERSNASDNTRWRRPAGRAFVLSGDAWTGDGFRHIEVATDRLALQVAAVGVFALAGWMVTRNR